MINKLKPPLGAFFSYFKDLKSIYILSFILFLISIFNVDTIIGEDHLLCKWSLVMGLAALIASYGIYKKYHLSLAILFGYLCMSAIYTFQWPTGYYFGYDNVIRVIIQHSSLVATISLISVFVIVNNIKELDKLKYFFIFLTIINSIFVISQWLNGNHEHSRGGLFRNVSINGCLIGACYPLLLEQFILKKDKVLNLFQEILYDVILVLPIIAILCSKSSVAIGVIAVALSVFFFRIIKFKKIAFGIGIFFFSLIIMLGHLTNKNMFNDSKRFGLYKIQYEAWLNQGQHLLGYGTGSYKFFGVKTQMQKEYMMKKGKDGKFKGHMNQWLHNDWLQLLLENGIIGMFLIFNALMFLLIKAWKHETIFACLITYMSAMVFHYPIHYPIHAIFGLWLIACVMKREEMRFKKEGIVQWQI